MGEDKGLIQHGLKTWSKNIANLLSLLLPECYISIRQEQYPYYKIFFNKDEIIFDENDIAIEGPLRGLLSAHKIYPEKNWLVIACDMIDINQNIITNLINRFSDDPGYDHYLYKSENNLEPLCAIYKGQGLSRIFETAKNSRNFSLQKNLPLEKCSILVAEKEDIRRLKSINTKEDLNHLFSGGERHA